MKSLKSCFHSAMSFQKCIICPYAKNNITVSTRHLRTALYVNYTCVSEILWLNRCTIIPFTCNVYIVYFRYGPLVTTWCMRYEAKHRYFKRLAVTTGNFINLLYTLSKRYQETVSHRLQTSDGSLSSFIEEGLEIGPGSVIV